MNTNVYENTDSETITPLNKRRILPVFLLVGLYAASTAAVMSVLPFISARWAVRRLSLESSSPLRLLANFVQRPDWPPFRSRWPQANTDCHAGYCGDKFTITRQRAMYPVYPARPHAFGISAGNLSAAAAYIADCTHVRNRRRAIGILTGCIGLGGIVGAGVSGWLSRISLGAPIYAAFILVLGAAPVAIWG